VSAPWFDPRSVDDWEQTPAEQDRIGRLAMLSMVGAPSATEQILARMREEERDVSTVPEVRVEGRTHLLSGVPQEA
jgi:hypothetical protein